MGEDAKQHELGNVFLRVYCIGDWGRPNPGLASSMNDYATLNGNPDCILALGDNFYPSGVESVEDELFNSCWKDIYLKYSNLCCPWHLILGTYF